MQIGREGRVSCTVDLSVRSEILIVDLEEIWGFWEALKDALVWLVVISVSLFSK